ncbi:hypothetical protein [Marinivivus vitaminiproducens]|uniref:hypothetical protein n=1 Tax=Marinivivus vitaminiproducens TaxID=3035935 RepID=UPI0027A85739|nr:hypothetical protein P4R82_05450 [Geminicoccaceae bacterium SCSIO 64248]
MSPNLMGHIVREIPRLRRHATLLLDGDADRADDMVQDCLEQAAGILKSDASSASVRVGLFRLLHRALVDFRHRSSDASSLNIAQQPHAAVAIMLLVALEGMSIEETASVTGLDTETVEFCVEQTRNTLRHVVSAPPRAAVEPSEDEALIELFDLRS